MNTFLTAQTELSGSNEIAKVVAVLSTISLMVRIYNRGIREQRNGKLLSHYYPDAPKRLRRMNKGVKIFNTI